MYSAALGPAAEDVGVDDGDS